MDDLDEIIPCRTVQIKALRNLFSPSLPSPPSIVIHGLTATGKTIVTKDVLESLQVPHVIISCRESITARHLFEQIVASSRQVVQSLGHELSRTSSRCENLNSLENQLEKILQKVPKFIIVLDGIDRQRESVPTLITGLARFGSIIKGLTIVFIVSVPSPRLWQTSGIPHLHFPPYSKEESIKILSLDPPIIFARPVDDSYDYGEEEAVEDRKFLWPKYCAIVWDAVGKSAARDFNSLRTLCQKLWGPFIQPILDGHFGTRDFQKLVVNRRVIFQSEEPLSGSLISNQPLEKKTGVNELPYYSKFLLCAAYLASFNPARQDQVYFMRSSERKRKKRAGGVVPGRRPKTKKIPRNLLNPSPFSLNRMLSIFHAILPGMIPQTSLIQAQVATLTSLRLIHRAGSGTDILDPTTRYRVNCTWDYVSTLGRSVGLEMRDYLAT